MTWAIWDASTTAILVGIAVGIIGSVGTAGAALYSRFTAAGTRAEMDRVSAASKACEDRYERLSVRFDALEGAYRESEKRAAVWELRWQIATGNVPTPTPLPPKSESG